MKQHKRASADSNLPVVTKRTDGKYSVQVAHDCHILWWCERRDDEEHWYVCVKTPNDVPINEVRDGAVITRPARH